MELDLFFLKMFLTLTSRHDNRLPRAHRHRHNPIDVQRFAQLLEHQILHLQRLGHNQHSDVDLIVGGRHNDRVHQHIDRHVRDAIHANWEDIDGDRDAGFLRELVARFLLEHMEYVLDGIDESLGVKRQAVNVEMIVDPSGRQ